jgi:uncharacterized membrane protein YbjE (DUF340 family)
LVLLVLSIFAEIVLMDEKPNNENPLRKYGVYSTVVFQMLFIIAISFWGGNKLSEYYQLKTKLLTVAIGFAGLCLAMYVTLKRLDEINRREEESNKK